MSASSAATAAARTANSPLSLPRCARSRPPPCRRKTTLTLAAQYLGSDLRADVLNFNRSSDKYRIEVTDYSEFNTEDDYTAGLTRLNTEIISGNTPDILAVSGLPIEQYAAPRSDRGSLSLSGRRR